MQKQNDVIISLKKRGSTREEIVLQPVQGSEIPEGTLRTFLPYFDLVIHCIVGFFVVFYLIALIILSTSYESDTCAKTLMAQVQTGMAANPQFICKFFARREKKKHLLQKCICLVLCSFYSFSDTNRHVPSFYGFLVPLWYTELSNTK